MLGDVGKKRIYWMTPTDANSSDGAMLLCVEKEGGKRGRGSGTSIQRPTVVMVLCC